MIETQSENDIHTITLNRPEQRNALTPRMCDDLQNAIAACPVSMRVLVLGGAGPMFCSGFDLALCNQSSDGSVLKELLRGLAGVLARLQASRCPVIIAAQGAAIAGGCAMLTAADHVVTDAGAKFGYPVHRIGLSPAVSLPTLTEKVGTGGVRPLALDGKLIGGSRAFEIGLVHNVVETAAEVWPAAQATARAWAAKPPLAMKATRDWLRQVSPLDANTVRAALHASLETAGTEEQARLLPELVRSMVKPELKPNN